MILLKVDEIMEAGNKIGLGVINGGSEVEVSRMVVSMVEERTNEMGIDDVMARGLSCASNVDIQSPMLTFMSILDMFIGMPKIRTSFETDSAIVTSGGITVVYSGMEIFEESPKIVVVFILDAFTEPLRLPVSSKFDLTGESL